LQLTTVLPLVFKDLDMMVDDLQGEKTRRELRGIVGDLKTKLERCRPFYYVIIFSLKHTHSVRTDSRTALLTSKRNIESRNKSNRDELLSSNPPGGERVLDEKSSCVFWPTCYLYTLIVLDPQW
jgi:protein transport protein SEC20